LHRWTENVGALLLEGFIELRTPDHDVIRTVLELRTPDHDVFRTNLELRALDHDVIRTAEGSKVFFPSLRGSSRPSWSTSPFFTTKDMKSTKIAENPPPSVPSYVDSVLSVVKAEVLHHRGHRDHRVTASQAG
jgi:hypothetical protein